MCMKKYINCCRRSSACCSENKLAGWVTHRHVILLFRVVCLSYIIIHTDISYSILKHKIQLTKDRFSMCIRWVINHFSSNRCLRRFTRNSLLKDDSYYQNSLLQIYISHNYCGPKSVLRYFIASNMCRHIKHTCTSILQKKLYVLGRCKSVSRD